MNNIFHNKKNALYLSVTVFNMKKKKKIGDTSLNGDGTAILCGHPCEGIAACRAKEVPSLFSHF